MEDIYSYDYMPQAVQTLRVTSFRGIDRSMPEGSLPVSPECCTPAGRNFWIDRGVLCPRNNYEPVLPRTVTASMADGKTYRIRSLHVFAAKGDSAAVPMLLAGVDAYLGGVRQYSCLLHRRLDMSGDWSEVRSGLLSVFGNNRFIRFRSADCTFVNFTGNFLLDKSDDSAAVFCNGVDMPMAYVGAGGGGLYPLASRGWLDVSCDSASRRFTCAGLATNGNEIEFFSRTMNYPSGIACLPMDPKKYYVINVSGATFQVSETLNGSVAPFTSNGADVMARLVSNRATDAPKGGNVFVHGDRLWMNIGNTLYHSDNFHADEDGAGYAHSRDWSTPLRTGNVPVLTFDGDAIVASREYNGSPIIIKENSVWRITNATVPYGVSQVFSTKGTIARGSVCEYQGTLLYATADGIMAFNGASGAAFLTDELRGIWNPDNADCRCAVAGDALYVYGNMTDPVTGAISKGVLAVHLPTKNVCYWDTKLGGNALKTDCSLDAWYTTLAPGIFAPQWWFADDDMIWRISAAAPVSTEDMSYAIPATDLGTAVRRKRISRVAATGAGGALLVAPAADGVPKPGKTLMLPATPGVTRPVALGASGRRMGFTLSNVTGSAPALQSLDIEYSIGG